MPVDFSRYQTYTPSFPPADSQIVTPHGSCSDAIKVGPQGLSQNIQTALCLKKHLENKFNISVIPSSKGIICSYDDPRKNIQIKSEIIRYCESNNLSVNNFGFHHY